MGRGGETVKRHTACGNGGQTKVSVDPPKQITAEKSNLEKQAPKVLLLALTWIK